MKKKLSLLCLLVCLLTVLENVLMVVHNKMQGSSMTHSLTVFSCEEFHMGREESKWDI